MADSISHRPAGLITISAACGDSLPGRKLDHSSFESHLKVAHFHADDIVSDFSLALGHMDNDRLFFMFLKTPNFSRRFRSEETERFFSSSIHTRNYGNDGEDGQKTGAVIVSVTCFAYFTTFFLDVSFSTW